MMQPMKWLRGRSKPFLAALTVALLGGAAVVVAAARTDAPCCAPGMPCCHPGSPCCARYHHTHDHGA